MPHFALQALPLLRLDVSALAQTPGPVGIITGTVRGCNTQELLVGVTVQIDNSTGITAKSTGANTDSGGRFKLTLLFLKNLTSIFLLLFTITSITAPESLAQETLDIKISNIRKNSGKIVVELYNSKANWLKNPVKKLELSPDQDSQTASFQVPYGKYAITVYQDVNINGETDMNFMGIPKEPVGFGNNYKPFGEPKFESALVEFRADSKPQEIKLFKVF